MFKANRLQNVNSELYGTDVFYIREEVKGPSRTDYIDFGKYKFKYKCPYDQKEVL